MIGGREDQSHLRGGVARIAPGYISNAVDAMSTQQIRAILIVLVGVIMLLASMGTAWALSRYSRAGSGERGWFVITILVGAALFVGGIIVCNYGVRALLDG